MANNPNQTSGRISLRDNEIRAASGSELSNDDDGCVEMPQPEEIEES